MFINHFLGRTPSGPREGMVGVLDGLMGKAAGDPEAGGQSHPSLEPVDFARQNKRGKIIQPHTLSGGGGMCFQIEFPFWKIKSD